MHQEAAPAPEAQQCRQQLNGGAAKPNPNVGTKRRMSELCRKLALLNAPCLRNRLTICLRGRWEGRRSLPKSAKTWNRAKSWDEGSPKSTKNQRVKTGIIVSGCQAKIKCQQAQREPRLDLRSLQLLHQRTKNTTLSRSIPTRSTRGAKATLCGCEAKPVAQPRICPTVGESSHQLLRLPEDRANTRGEAGGGPATVRSANRPHVYHSSRNRESGFGRDQK